MERQISAVDHTSRITAMQDRIDASSRIHDAILIWNARNCAHAARIAFDDLFPSLP